MKYILLAAMLMTTPAAAAPFNEQWAAIMEDLQVMELNYHGSQPRAVKTDRIKVKFEDQVLQVAEPPPQKSVRKRVAKADACTKVGKRKVMTSRYRWACR